MIKSIIFFGDTKYFSYFEHVSDLLRVDVEVLAGVDGDDGGAGVGLDQVVHVPLSQGVEH